MRAAGKDEKMLEGMIEQMAKTTDQVRARLAAEDSVEPRQRDRTKA